MLNFVRKICVMNSKLLFFFLFQYWMWFSLNTRLNYLQICTYFHLPEKRHHFLWMVPQATCPHIPTIAKKPQKVCSLFIRYLPVGKNPTARITLLNTKYECVPLFSNYLHHPQKVVTLFAHCFASRMKFSPQI